MKRVRGLHVTIGLAAAALFCVAPVLSPAKRPNIRQQLLADNGDEDKEGRPIAKPMLAVTRLPPGKVCHVATIDAQANPNPNELARRAADELARDFQCGKDEVKVIGETGTAVRLAKR